MLSQPAPLSFSSKARRTREQPINALISAAMANPKLINFAAGLVDSHTLPTDACAAIANTILADRVRLIYCTSYFQNPTGLTLSLERRPRLLEIAKKFSKSHRILILEDSAYRELRYDGPALPSIKSFDRDNTQVVLACTFSKPFAP